MYTQCQCVSNYERIFAFFMSLSIYWTQHVGSSRWGMENRARRPQKTIRCHSVEHDNDFSFIYFLSFRRDAPSSVIFFCAYSPLHTMAIFFSCTFTELFTSFFLPSLAVFCCSYLAFTPIIISEKSYNFLTPCRACKLHFASLAGSRELSYYYFFAQK